MSHHKKEAVDPGQVRRNLHRYLSHEAVDAYMASEEVARAVVEDPSLREYAEQVKQTITADQEWAAGYVARHLAALEAK